MARINIKPISDLNQYSEVLKEVAIGSPVYLTKNGHGKYVIYDIDDPVVLVADKYSLSEDLLEQIKVAHELSDKKGWLTIEDVVKALELRKNSK